MVGEPDERRTGIRQRVPRVPRARVALVAVLVAVNVTVVVALRGDQLHKARLARVCPKHDYCLCGHGVDHFVWPWEWTLDEWCETWR